MNKRTIFGILALLVILAVIIVAQQARKNKKSEEQAGPVISLAAFNETKNVDAETVPANPNDVVVYTLSANNQNNKDISGYVMEINIGQITPVATLVDASGANYNSATNSLVWTPLDIPKDGTIEKKFTVRIREDVPVGDLTMTARFNNEVTVHIVKQQVAGNTTPPPATPPVAPRTGPGVWVVFLLASATTVGISLIRHKIFR